MIHIYEIFLAVLKMIVQSFRFVQRKVLREVTLKAFWFKPGPLAMVSPPEASS